MAFHSTNSFHDACCCHRLQVQLKRRQDQLQTELEECGDDMDNMAKLLDEMELLNSSATDLDMTLLDRNIDKMMPELGFTPEDSDQLVAAYRCPSCDASRAWTPTVHLLHKSHEAEDDRACSAIFTTFELADLHGKCLLLACDNSCHCFCLQCSVGATTRASYNCLDRHRPCAGMRAALPHHVKRNP